MYLKTGNKIAVGAAILLMGASLLAMRPHAANESAQHITQAHLRLASLSTVDVTKPRPQVPGDGNSTIATRPNEPTREGPSSSSPSWRSVA